MEVRVCIRTGLILIFGFLLLPVLSFAQTNVGDAITDTVGGVIKGEFESHTGLDKVKDIKDIDAGALADKTVEYIVGEVPSQIMANLVTQITVGPDIKTPTPFTNLFLKKEPFGNRSKVIPACHLAANEKMREGLFELRVRGHFSPWIDIAWTAVKSIADGGKTISELIAEHTKAKAEELIKETLFGTPEPKVETYTYEHGDSCNTTTKVTWDPVNMRIIAVTTGDCKCERKDTDCGPTKLKGYQVVFHAPVVISVRIKTEERLFGWISPKHTVQAKYRVDLDRMKVVTHADCDCKNDPPPPPEDPGFITGIFEWISGLFDSPAEPEDATEEPEDNGESGEGTDEGTDEGETTDEGEEDTTGVSGIPAFVDWLLGRDKTDEPEDTNTTGHTSGGEESGKGENGEEKPPLQCGATVSVDGRSGVPTFPYRPDANGDVNFSCNNSCAPDQVCKVLPESVGAFRDSCVYCADKPKTDTPPQPPITDTAPVSGNNCEAAVRLLLDEYMGWFDPPVTFSANRAVMSHEHRCFPEADFDTHTRQLAIEGTRDAKITAMCPSLKHVSSTLTKISGGAKGLCSSETVFSF